ncbi:uncharacterized protein LOC113331019 [Papaver somniferum]|uniref:uncharacterized protein LOC113331019 n=1 Tax=Papaver somniferum TaxID=3469 RepID=UPI000E6FF1FB|nr:uncharacterized protein LOC113331019 [Papaver somniferum]
MDLPMVGGLFTWSNLQNPPLLSRLDRFVVSPDWEDRCPALLQSRMKRPVSDHALVMLSYNGGITIKSPFRFENYFLNHPEFLNCFKICWNNLTFYGKSSFVLAKKLQGLKFFIKKWGRENFGSLQAEVNRMEDLIDVMDSLEEINTFSNEEFVEREDFKIKQKYKANGISYLIIDDAMTHDKDDINAEAKRFYTEFFAEHTPLRPAFGDLILPSLSVNHSIMLEKHFEEKEIKNVLNCFGKNKSPRPDGYTMEFFKATWEMIKHELMGFF